MVFHGSVPMGKVHAAAPAFGAASPVFAVGSAGHGNLPDVPANCSSAAFAAAKLVAVLDELAVPELPRKSVVIAKKRTAAPTRAITTKIKLTPCWRRFISMRARPERRLVDHAQD
jgi:hypothetical protein